MNWDSLNKHSPTKAFNFHATLILLSERIWWRIQSTNLLSLWFFFPFSARCPSQCWLVLLSSIQPRLPRLDSLTGSLANRTLANFLLTHVVAVEPHISRQMPWSCFVCGVFLEWCPIGGRAVWVECEMLEKKVSSPTPSWSFWDEGAVTATLSLHTVSAAMG